MEFEDFDISSLKRKNNVEEHLTKIFKNVKQLAQNVSHDYEAKNYDVIEHDMDVLTATIINVNEFLNDKKDITIKTQDGKELNYLGEEKQDQSNATDTNDNVVLSENDYIENIMGLNRKIESHSFSLDDLKQINENSTDSDAQPEDSGTEDEWDF